MKKLTYRQQYDFEEDAIERANTDIDFTDHESMTIQDAPDADLNVLIARFGITDGSRLPAAMGIIDPAYYGDFTDLPDLRTALDRTREASDRFNSLPAQLRNRFGNDPYELYTWVTRPENAEEAVRLGLLAKAALKPNVEPNPPFEQNPAA